jgi:hypothetical protein
MHLQYNGGILKPVMKGNMIFRGNTQKPILHEVYVCNRILRAIDPMLEVCVSLKEEL